MSRPTLSNKKLIALAAVAALAASCAPYHAQKGVTKFRQKGKASWYGPGFAGRKTANGERFNPGSMTAAHRTLPFGTTVKVTNLSNDKSVVVRINDRGPYAGRRIIDLSKAAARKIGLIESGVGVVEIKALGPGEGKAAAKQDREKTKVLIAARGGRVRRNGVEHLISVETKSNPEIAAAKDEAPAAEEAAEDEPAEPASPAEEAEDTAAPYSVDDEPF